MHNNPSQYIRLFAKILIQALLLILVTLAVTLALFFGGKSFWFLFVETNIGQRYTTYFPKNAHAIADLLTVISVPFSVTLTLVSFAVCQTVTAFMQLIHASRRYHQGRSRLFSLLVWPLPLATLVAWHIRPLHGLDWQAAILCALVPTLCLFIPCLDFSRELIPEIGEMVNRLGDLIYQRLPNRLKFWCSDWEYELATIKQLLTQTIIATLSTFFFLKIADMFLAVLSTNRNGQELTARLAPLGISLPEILSQDQGCLAIRLTGTAVLTCLAIGAVGQFAHILRRHYINKGLANHILLWILPLTTLNAMLLRQTYIFTQWPTAFVATLLPIALVSGACLNCLYVILPEAGELVKRFRTKS